MMLLVIIRMENTSSYFMKFWILNVYVAKFEPSIQTISPSNAMVSAASMYMYNWTYMLSLNLEQIVDKDCYTVCTCNVVEAAKMHASILALFLQSTSTLPSAV